MMKALLEASKKIESSLLMKLRLRSDKIKNPIIIEKTFGFAGR